MRNGEKNEKEPTPVEKEFMEVFNKLIEHIKPADKDTRTGYKSTEQFYEILSNHYPAMVEVVSINQLYDLLKDSGFKTDYFNGELVWMVHEK